MLSMFPKRYQITTIETLMIITFHFRKVLNLALQQSLSETTVTVELLDHLQRPTETDITVSFHNHLTQEPMYEFVHYRDKNGKTDTLEIEPVIAYDVIANTIPPVMLKNGGKMKKNL